MNLFSSFSVEKCGYSRIFLFSLPFFFNPLSSASLSFICFIICTFVSNFATLHSIYTVWIRVDWFGRTVFEAPRTLYTPNGRNHDENWSQIVFHRNSISQLHRTLIYTLLNIMSVYFFFTLPFLPVCRTVLFSVVRFCYPIGSRLYVFYRKRHLMYNVKSLLFFPLH